MDKKVLVVYSSKYGTTKQYAKWIAEALGAKLAEAKAVKPQDLQTYDVVVYGGGLYAGGIAGVKLVTRNPCKNLVVFTVGLADPSTTDYSAILNKNIPPELLVKTKVFHLRGGIDYKQLGPIHKVMMAMMKSVIQKKPEDKRAPDDQEFLKTYGAKVNFSDSQSIEPLVGSVKSL